MNPYRRLAIVLALVSCLAGLTAASESASARATGGRSAHRPKAPASPLPPAAAIAVNPRNDDQYAFWRTPGGRIEEAWNNGSWHGPVSRGWAAASAPAAAVNAAGHQFVTWQGAGGDVFEATFTGRRWGRPRNMTRSNHWGRGGTTTTVPAVAVAATSDNQYLFWRGPDGRIHDVTSTRGRWHRPGSQGWASSSAPTADVDTAGHQFVFWRSSGADIIEASNDGRWSRPRDLTRTYRWGHSGQASSAPAAALAPGSENQYVFWRGPGGRIYEAWDTGSWHRPAGLGWAADSAPSAAVSADRHQYVLWLGPGSRLDQSLYRTGWAGPVARWLLSPGPGAYADVVQTTANLSERMTPLADVQFSHARTGRLPVIRVNDGVRYQRVKGVGAAMTDTSAWLIQNHLSAAKRNQLMDDLFTTDGVHLGFTLIPIGGSDFSVGGVPYTYDDLPSGQSDPTLAHFSIGHDQAYILPVLRQMLAVAPGTETFAVPWSPPGWMKANDALDDLQHRGTLLSGAYPTLASYFVKVLQAYAQAGVSIDAVAPENEPRAASAFPAMYFPEPNEAQWIASDLAPALQAAHLNPKVYGNDTSWQLENYALSLVASSARNALAGIAWHCYGGIPTVMNDLHSASASLDQIVTECAPNLSRYSVPEILIGAMRNWASEVTLWNIATDPAGGPVEPPNSGCRGCHGLVTINESNGALTFNLDYYQLGQVGSFVESGAWRIASNTFVRYTRSGSAYGASAGLDDVALHNPDGSRVLVVYNNSGATGRFAVTWRGRSFTYSLPPRATVTFRWNP